MKQKKKPGFGKLEIKELSSTRYERVNGKMVKGGGMSTARTCDCSGAFAITTCPAR